MKGLPKEYGHQEAEKRWQQHWRKSGTYHFHDDRPRAETFVIDTPPPTVSGVLHMGHVFSYTQADFIARYQRMNGKDVFYPMGFDDNGLPTERLVEKTLGIRAHQLPREEFVAKCREVVVGAEEEFRKLFESIALSVDWRQEYQTISDDVRALSQASFIDLHAKGLAYRQLQPMLWDPVDQTAIAQAEIEDKELPSHFSDIVFGIENVYDTVTIGTTRPELLGACVALLYHPDDERYTHLKGRLAVTPLFGAKVPCLADEDVQMDKGTGLVMCCTFGDETDIVWWRRHELDTRVILNKYGKLEFPGDVKEHYTLIEEGLFEALTGKKAADARKITLELLAKHKLLVKQEAITHVVKCAERSGAPLEILPTYQWFVNVLDHKEALKEKARQCDWHPEFMRLRIEQWIDGLSWDWCISRQRFFGVPFPVWNFKKEGEEEGIDILARLEDLPIDPLQVLPCGFEKLPDTFANAEDGPDGWKEYYKAATLVKAVEDIYNHQGKLVIKAGTSGIIVPSIDVMDTWATSSLTPQINARLLGSFYTCHPGESRDPEKKEGWIPDRASLARDDKKIDPRLRGDENKLFPADLRPQAHEIIRTWAFYTIVKAHLHADSIPWKHLMISGWCLAPDKTKMSKSKGNVVTPVALVEEKGADAVRYWASTSRLGMDTAFSEDALKIGRKLVTKLWNASNFVAIQLADFHAHMHTPAEDTEKGRIAEALDKWILTRLHRAVTKATLEFERFEYCDARVTVEDFFWNDFCDNYLELVKARAYGESVEKTAQQSAQLALYHCLNTVLRLFAPFVPHVTEEIYSHLFPTHYKQEGSLHTRGQWPKAADYPLDEKAEACGMAAVEVLSAIRRAKSEAGVSIKFPVEEVRITALPGGPGCVALASALEDVKAAGNVAVIVKGAEESAPVSERGWFRLGVRLAADKAGDQVRA